MTTELENVRNVTISTKVSAAEKIELQQIANDNNITRSELIYDLLSAYKNCYAYIGKTSPKEDKLSAELKNATREVNKLSIELENAQVRIEMERKEINKQQEEIHKLTNRNMDLKREVAKLKSERENLQQQIIKQEEIINSQDKNDDNLPIGYSVGALGLASLFILFKN